MGMRSIFDIGDQWLNGTYIWVAIGGGIGATGRFWLSGVTARLIGETFPWGTLLINVDRLVRHRLFLCADRPERKSLCRIDRPPVRDDRHLRRLHHLFVIQPANT